MLTSETSRPSLHSDNATGALFGEVISSTEYAKLIDAWDNLVADCLEPNAFMSPQFLGALTPANERCVVVVWRRSTGSISLEGVVSATPRALHEFLPLGICSEEINVFCFHSYPVVRRHGSKEILRCLLDTIAHEPRFPNTIFWRNSYAVGPMWELLLAVLSERGVAPLQVQRRSRSVLSKNLGAKGIEVSKSRDKKFRQYRRRLEALGVVTEHCHSNSEDIHQVIEEFLRLEASGWKGRSGTAILCNHSDACFTRGWLGSLAAKGALQIHALRLSGKPISMYVWVQSGGTAFAWKIAYDEDYSEYHPGLLCLELATRHFLNDPSLIVADSCTWSANSVNSIYWRPHVPMAGLLFDARRDHFLWSTTIGHAAQLFFTARSVGGRTFREARNWLRSMLAGSAGTTSPQCDLGSSQRSIYRLRTH